MPSRRVRRESTHAIHHAIPQGNGGCAIVADDIDRGWLMRELRRTVEDHRWLLTAFALLDTHLHVVVETPEPNLSKGMQAFQGRYARRFNARHGRFGSLFRGRYWSRRIESGGHLVRSAIYVAANPVAAGLCAEPGDWPWSSYHETAGHCDPTGLLRPERLLATLAQDSERSREQYVALVAEACARVHNTRRMATYTRGASG